MRGVLRVRVPSSGGADGRIGQEAPEQQEEPVHDGRTLFERLQTAQVRVGSWMSLSLSRFALFGPYPAGPSLLLVVNDHSRTLCMERATEEPRMPRAVHDPSRPFYRRAHAIPHITPNRASPRCLIPPSAR